MEEKSSIELSQALVEFKEIPEYQRDFVWGEEQIEGFLEGMGEACNKPIPENLFMGALVFQRLKNPYYAVYNIVDGQQRITVLFLFIAAACHHHKRFGNNEAYVGALKNKYLIDLAGNTDQMELKLKPKDDDLLTLFKSIIDDPDLSYDSSKMKKLGVTARKILAGLELCRTYLKREYPLEESDSGKRLRSMFNFIGAHLRMSYYVSQDDMESLEVYERLNSSGKPLELLEISKGYMFRSLERDEKQWNRLRLKWSDFQKKLEKAKFKSDSVFMRYFLALEFKDFIIEQNDKDNRKGSATGVLPTQRMLPFIKQNTREIFKDPFDIVKRLEGFTNKYLLMREGKDIFKKDCPPMANILHIASTSSTQNIMLMNCRNSKIFEFASKVAERQVLINRLLSKYTGETEKRFTKWGLDIHRKQTARISDDQLIDEMRVVVLDDFKTDRDLVEAAIKSARWASGTKTKLILQIVELRLDEIAGQGIWNSTLERVGGSNTSLDHIIVRKDKSLDEDLSHCVGNLALLDSVSQNSARGVLPWEDDKSQTLYRGSVFYGTKGMCTDISGESGYSKALERITSRKTWTEESIHDRTKYICGLVKEYIEVF